MILQLPRVSTASNLLMIPLDFAISSIPRARVKVNTAGNPSGTAATASATAVIKFSTRPIPSKDSSMNTNTQVIMAMKPRIFPSLSTFS